jgi:carboxyl-terminal processing protease
MSLTPLLRRCSVFFLLLTVPVGVGAASYEGMLPGGAKQVTRADFLRASIEALDLPLKEDGRVPIGDAHASLWPQLRTADEFGALDVFGKSFQGDKAITRMEAARVLSALTRAKPKTDATSTYADVKAGEDAFAAAVAVQHKWLKPLRKNTFGAARPLTGRDARTMLKIVAVPDAPVEAEVPTAVVRLKTKQKSPLPDDEMLRTIWKLLNDEYLRPEKIDEKAASYKAAEALVESLGDPYSTFMPPKKAQEFSSQLDGEITGIGAQVEFKDKELVIMSPIKGSPAEKAGLKPGDVILSVNGESLAGLGFIESVDKVRGPKGSSAVLRIRRDGIEMDVTVVRDTVKVPEVEVSWKGNIAVVSIFQFGQRTDRELRGMMAEIQAKHPVGIVVDLRNNPGGYLHAADVVASIFLPKGSVVATIVARDGEHLEMTGEEPIVEASTPVVVLVNKGSASASEIVAGALQDAKRAKVVGETSFGKGTVQQIMEFTDGSSLKLTVAEWLTPKRRKIDGIGVTPDVVVADDPQDKADEQMLRALELVR